MKNQKGITLIALVITIIVLLILAGVAIAMLSGDNGILNRASKASTESAIGTAKDEIYVIATDTLTEYYENTYVGSNTTPYSSDDLDTAVIAAIGNGTEYADNKVKTSWSGKKITLTHDDGSTLEGDLVAGKITWDEKVDFVKDAAQ